MRLDQSRAELVERAVLARKAAGLTQEQVAARLRDLARQAGAEWLVPQQFVSQVEHGRRLDAVEARWYALALNVDPDWLVHGLGVPTDNVSIQGVTARATVRPTPKGGNCRCTD